MLELPKENKGSEQLEPLVRAILDFYKAAFAEGNKSGGEYPMIKNDSVRLELFKLFYD